MRRRIGPAFPCLLVVLAAGLAACAGDDGPSRADYQESIVETRDRVDSAFANISQAQTRRDFSNRMEQASVLIGRAADDLGDTESPEEFEDETDRLERALRQFSVDLKGTAEQLRITPELFDNSPGLSFDGFTQFNNVLSALGRQGIKVEPLATH